MDRPRRDELQDWWLFIIAESHTLRRRPDLFFQQGANQPEGTSPCEWARSFLDSGRIVRPWARWVNKPRSRLRRLMVLAAGESPGNVESETAYDVSSDGRRIVAAAGGESLKVWDALMGREIMALNGHTGPVWRCAFSPDGLRIVSGSVDETLILWDAATGMPLKRMKGSGGPIGGCVFSDEGSRILSFSEGHGKAPEESLQAWDGRTGDPIAALGGHTGEILAGALSPDGSKAVSCAKDGTLRLWDIGTSREEAKLLEHSRDPELEYIVSPTDCAFSPDGRRIVASSGGYGYGALGVWEAATGACNGTFGEQREPVVACGFTPDGERIYGISMDGTLRLWRSEDRTLVITQTEKKSGARGSGVGKRPAFTREGKRVFFAGRVIDVSNGTALFKLEGFSGKVTTRAISPDGNRLVSASGSTIEIWDMTGAGDIGPDEALAEKVEGCVFSPDGRRLVSVSREERLLKLWTTEDGSMVRRMLGHLSYVGSCVFSPDGKRIASVSTDGKLRFWDGTDGSFVAETSAHGHECIREFSPDSRWFVSANAGLTAIKLWDALTGREIGELAEYPRTGSRVRFSPDGSQLASIDENGTAIKVWYTETGRVILHLARNGRNIESFGYSPDGSRIAWTEGSIEAVILSDASDGRILAALPGHAGTVHSCVHSPDGRRIVTSSSDGNLRLWDAGTGEPLGIERAFSPDPHRKKSLSCSFSPDGTRIVTIEAGNDNDRHFRLRDGFNLKPIAHLSRGDGGFAFSPDGSVVLVFSYGGLMSLNDARTGRLLGMSNSGPLSSFSPELRWIAAPAEDLHLVLWTSSGFVGGARHPRRGDFGNDAARIRFPFLGKPADVKWSPDGKRLALGTSAGLFLIEPSIESVGTARRP